MPSATGTRFALVTGMATLPSDARRSPRILFQLPLQIYGNGLAARAHTVVVNRYGALVLAAQAFPDDTMLKVENASTGKTTLCRVVWCGGEELPGLFKLGIEIMGNVGGFWGEEFEGRLRQTLGASETQGTAA